MERGGGSFELLCLFLGLEVARSEVDSYIGWRNQPLGSTPPPGAPGFILTVHCQVQNDKLTEL